ncbi:MAG: hypothetical protein ACYS6K_09445 [Planctomycetota bacterium]|jgi:hypothetical protein
MAAWFNKKTARAMAEMAESLKVESLARAQAEEKLRAEIEGKAAMERKVKAEAEKLLVSQFNKYNAMVERAESKAKEAMATARDQVKGAEKKVLSYEVALAQAEEKLSEAKEQLMAEALGRARAEESLKAESEERKRVEAQVAESIATAKANAEEKILSYAGILTETDKLSEAKEQEKAGAIAFAKVKAEDGLKCERKESQGFDAQSAEAINTFGRTRRGVFHPGNIKRKCILLLVLAIFSALTFELNVADEPPVTEFGGAMTPERIALEGSDTDGEQLNSDAAADPSFGTLTEPAADMSNAPALESGSEDNVTFKVDEEKAFRSQIPNY